MREVVIQKNLKGLKTEFKNTNDFKFERILNDDRDLDFIKFKVGVKLFKVQQKEDITIYSLIVSVPDTTNDLGYYSINVFSDSHQFIKNYKDILEAIENLYLATNMRGQDIDSQLSSILTKFLTHSLANFETRFVNKANKLLILDSNKIDDFQNPMKNIFVFEAVYYIPSEILNSDRGVRYMSNTDRIVKENEANQNYSFIKLSSNNNFTDCFIFIDGKRINSNDINSNPLYFFINKNSTLAYKYKYDESNEVKQITGNDFIIPRFIKPEIHFEKFTSQNVKNSYNNEFNDELELKLRNNRILSAVLGVLLLVSLIGNGWFVYNYLNPKQEEQNTSGTEFVPTEENKKDSTTTPASNIDTINPTPTNPNIDSSNIKNSNNGSSNAVTQNSGNTHKKQNNKDTVGKGKGGVAKKPLAITQQGNEVISNKKIKTTDEQK